MNRLKLIVVLILITLCAIIVMQNTQPVETKILFVTLTMPRAVLLFITTMFGFAMGILFSLIMSQRKKAKEESTTAAPAE